ncbi:hypothetical protein B0H19DRAFT_77031 [Mycena capillaripes]|nr:hypothetical protein B0H19DRAFT_77031 [Mycena capillaripes]
MSFSEYPRCVLPHRPESSAHRLFRVRRRTYGTFESRQRLSKHICPAKPPLNPNSRNRVMLFAMCDMLGAPAQPAEDDSEPFRPSCTRIPLASRVSRGREPALLTTFSSTAARTTESTSSDGPDTSALSIPASDSVHRHAQRGRQHELEHASGSHARRCSNRPRPCDVARVPSRPHHPPSVRRDSPSPRASPASASVRVLTTIASSVMTLSSLLFVIDCARACARTRRWLSINSFRRTSAQT